jgi:hypothetical protein
VVLPVVLPDLLAAVLLELDLLVLLAPVVFLAVPLAVPLELSVVVLPALDRLGRVLLAHPPPLDPTLAPRALKVPTRALLALGLLAAAPLVLAVPDLLRAALELLEV